MKHEDPRNYFLQELIKSQHRRKKKVVMKKTAQFTMIIMPFLVAAVLFMGMGMTGKSYIQTCGKRTITEMSWGAAESTALTEDIPINGKCTQIEFDCEEDTTGANTFTLTVATEDGGVLYTQATIPDNGSTIYRAYSKGATDSDFEAFLMAETVTVTVDINDVPGSSGATVNVGFYIE